MTVILRKDLKETEWEGVAWIDLAQDKDMHFRVLNTVRRTLLYRRNVAFFISKPGGMYEYGCPLKG
jgi:hypothetical protein